MIGRLLVISFILLNIQASANDKPSELFAPPSPPHLIQQQHDDFSKEIQLIEANKEVENKSAAWNFISTTIPNFFKDFLRDDPIPEEQLEDEGIFFLTLVLLSALASSE